MYKFLGIFLAGYWLFSCSSDKIEVVKALKKANAKDFSFSLLYVNTKEVSIEKVKSILKNPTGWTIKSLKIDDESFAEVTGTSVKDFKIKIKKAGEFSFSVTLQKTGYEDFILKGIKIKATFLANAKDFSFKLLELTGANEVTIEKLKKNLKSPVGWTIKTIAVADSSFGDVTGTGSAQKIVLKKGGGTFGITITLQKTGWVDYVLKGNIKAALFKADAKDFSFPELSVNAKEIPLDDIKRRVRKPADWTIKSIAVDNPTYAEKENQKIKIKAPTTYVTRTFTVSITLGGKTGWADYILSASIKADHSVWVLEFDKATKIITGVKDKTIKTINIPDEIDGVAVTKIGNKAFFNLTKLTSVTIPNSVTSIGPNIFSSCTSLVSVNIPNSLTSIPLGAFAHCISLVSVNIPNSVTSIGTNIFNSCTSLVSVTIPNSLTSIPFGAFAHCTSLASVTVPISVTSIGNSAFHNCSKLEVTVTQTDPSKITLGGSGIFTNVKQIKVPSASSDAYKAASGWSSHSGIIVGY